MSFGGWFHRGVVGNVGDCVYYLLFGSFACLGGRQLEVSRFVSCALGFADLFVLGCKND